MVTATAAPNTAWQDGLSVNTPDGLVDFIAAAARELVNRANAGRCGDDDQYRAALARSFDAITARLLAHPDADFAGRLRRSLLSAEHRLPALTRARLRSSAR